MFIFESKNANKDTVLNICFQATQVPPERSDIQIWKDAKGKTHVVVDGVEK